MIIIGVIEAIGCCMWVGFCKEKERERERFIKYMKCC